MGELLRSGGALLFSFPPPLPPSSSASSARHSSCASACSRAGPSGEAARLDEARSGRRAGFGAGGLSLNVESPKRRRDCARCFQECARLPLLRGRRRRRRRGAPFVGKLCGRVGRDELAAASLRRELVCDAFQTSMDDRVVAGDRFGTSAAGVKVLPWSSPGGIRVARVGHALCDSGIQGAVYNEYSRGPDSQVRIEGLRPGRAGIPARIHCRYIYRSHIEKRKVVAHSRPWWKQFLFQQLNEEGSDYDSEEDEENEEENDDEEDDEETLKDVKFPFRSPDSEELDEDEIDGMLEDDRRYFSWQDKRKVIDELREIEESGRDPDNRDWEDWLDDSWGDYSQYLGKKDDDWSNAESQWEKGGVPRQPPTLPERGMSRSFKELLVRIFEPQEEVEEDLGFEEKVFRFTSQSTAKFVTILILVPWAVSFLVHDFAVVPFLRRWMEEVPLAARLLDLRESQKLHMVERLKLERQRVRFEAQIGKAPPLSDAELNEHIHQEAHELGDELREENRQAFANIWSDAVAGFTILLLLVFNPGQVAIMQLTGDRIFTNISDTGKAFIIILGTDIFLGYHSELGWETVIKILLEHYGFEVSQGAIYLFVAIVPVTIDACFKLWVFRFLSRLSPSAAATFREMKRH